MNNLLIFFRYFNSFIAIGQNHRNLGVCCPLWGGIEIFYLLRSKLTIRVWIKDFSMHMSGSCRNLGMCCLLGLPHKYCSSLCLHYNQIIVLGSRIFYHALTEIVETCVSVVLYSPHTLSL